MPILFMTAHFCPASCMLAFMSRLAPSTACYLWKDVPQTSQSSNDKITIPPSCNLNMDIRVTGDLVPISSDLQPRGGVFPIIMQNGLSKGSLPWVSQLPDHLRGPNYCLSVNRLLEIGTSSPVSNYGISGIENE
ncbi:hypothetical protein ILYODFUR_015594 [Ilyodon furcidens]|uniref:Uncharacterized protein n=1 Tax=Ilyodon furcidens TaxID=33524 RepID=A0ABV0TUX4_9TELE